MTSSSSGGSFGLVALNSSYFTAQLRNQWNLPNPPPEKPRQQFVAPVAPEEGASVDIVA